MARTDSMQVKICGLTDKKEAAYLNGKADYAGMVLFFEKSKRNIDIDKAKEIMASLDSTIKKVAVVVSPGVEEAKTICEAGFDIIQVHGSLSDDVYDVINIDIWKAFNVKDIDEYEYFSKKEKIKGFVFDSATPGSGIGYDYKLLENIKREPGKKFILAGGLNAKNVAKAISEVAPDIVDVSSAVEYTDGRPGKDSAKIDEFIEACKVKFTI